MTHRETNYNTHMKCECSQFSNATVTCYQRLEIEEAHYLVLNSHRDWKVISTRCPNREKLVSEGLEEIENYGEYTFVVQKQIVF